MAKQLHNQTDHPDIKNLNFEERLGLLIDMEITARDNRRMQQVIGWHGPRVNRNHALCGQKIRRHLVAARGNELRHQPVTSLLPGGERRLLQHPALQIPAQNPAGEHEAVHNGDFPCNARYRQADNAVITKPVAERNHEGALAAGLRQISQFADAMAMGAQVELVGLPA